MEDGRDVAAFLAALPSETLSPELIALRDLDAVVDLAYHWPVVHVTQIPVQYARLGMAALPTFKRVYVDAGFTALDWLDAKLPPKMPVTLVIDQAVSGAASAFAYVWGNRITSVIAKGHEVHPDPIPDLLGRCVNVQSVKIAHATMPVDAAAYVAAIPLQYLHTLDVHVTASGALDTSGLVAWLHGPNATSLTLSCDSVSNPTSLVAAIEACATLSYLDLDDASNVQDALSTSPFVLEHVGVLTQSQWSDTYADILTKLRPGHVRSFLFEKKLGDRLVLPHVVDALGECPQLEVVGFIRVHIPRISTFEDPRDVLTIVRWLSTSRHLASVDLDGTVLGREGALELARTLPAWMLRGLETLQLRGTGLNDEDAVVLAIALASGTNRRPLTIDLTGNELTIASAPVLLTMLGASRNVTLRLDGPFVLTGQDVLCDLVRVHSLDHSVPGRFSSPSHVSSLWHSI
ncbi:hypothetical protein SDRG_11895 [Saprolegnia diclina VS20]|uniref:Uncharacterized protein n=1 Tax=Saprolegnia diclina (strain VS20) TaxID=1156394 RepID=T0RDI2_SAPDV|nr:hypothetical protein SDRG_11895 [Saprolegnia diclina VS20]EQC30318.1 hypothetical protein SDRG_11895 [Saprolegnia diclina VS20]|eukprot:XP_008616171.1 hypothetical protein SDRG_11895 [Saprolegnia diclina VS20]